MREIDVGKSIESVLSDGPNLMGSDWSRLTSDMYKILIDKAEGEAYDKIKTVPNGEGMRAYLILYRWFTDVTGVGLAEQARKLRHPDALLLHVNLKGSL